MDVVSENTGPAESSPTVTDVRVASLRGVAGGGDPAAACSSNLSIVERDINGVRILGTSGELDLAAAAELCARVDAARHAGHRRLLLDLTRLEFCDSSGLRALIGAATEVRASAGRVVMVPPVAGAVARLFALTGANELLPLRASVADGLAALGARGAG